MSIADIEKNLNAYIKQKSQSVLKVLEVEGRISVNMNFEQGGRPSKWTPSQKLSRRPGSKTLIQKGNLRSISTRRDESSYRVIFGLNPLARAYGEIHNEGGRINHPGRKRRDGSRGNPYVINIPRREFLVIPKQDFSRILNSVSRVFK
jgi:phage gpG-like protein